MVKSQPISNKYKKKKKKLALDNIRERDKLYVVLRLIIDRRLDLSIHTLENTFFTLILNNIRYVEPLEKDEDQIGWITRSEKWFNNFI